MCDAVRSSRHCSRYSMWLMTWTVASFSLCAGRGARSLIVDGMLRGRGGAKDMRACRIYEARIVAEAFILKGVLGLAISGEGAV